MLFAFGITLVLVTWVAASLVVVALGALPALVIDRCQVTAATVRAAVWWGLLVLTILALVLGSLMALRSTVAMVAVTGGALIGAVLAVPVVRARGWRRPSPWRGRTWWVVAGMLVAVVVVAVFAVGPVTNYDSGLYHLGAIRYAADFPAIPGLANLYGPLGYGTAEFPLAAVLGNGPLGDDAFRTVNGLVIVLAALDLVLRVTRRTWVAGTFVLLVGLTVALVPMLLAVDYWVTSPSQDSSVLVLTVVASAYLTDAVAHSRRVTSDGAVAVVLAILLVLLRPTMVTFSTALVVVVVVRLWRMRDRIPVSVMRPAGLLLLLASALAAAALAVRDYLLSGWFLYPLSILPFDVAWRAADPVALREATLGFWRNPDDMWGSVEGWAWVGPWFAGLSRQWEIYAVGTLAIAVVVVTVLAARAGTLRGRSLLAATVPSLLATAAWWVASPPGFRFIWGPLFTAFTVPMGWCLWRLSRTEAGAWATGVTVGATTAILAAAGAATIVWAPAAEGTLERTVAVGPVELPFAVAALPKPPVEPVATEGGLTVAVPTESDQCWGVFPLCTPATSPTLRLRGSDLASGFLP